MHRFGPVLRLLCAGLALAVLADCADFRDHPPDPQLGLSGCVDPDKRPAPVAVELQLSAEELAEAWFEQLHGFDALEAYEVVSARGRYEFALARKWEPGRVKLLIYAVSPASIRDLAALYFRNRDLPDELFVYLPPRMVPSDVPRRVRRFPASDLMPAVLTRGVASLVDLRPIFRGELSHRRLPDATVQGESCRVVESRFRGGSSGFDRIQLVLSRRTGVALCTRYFRGERELRRVFVAPGDVREYDGRWLPTRRRVERPGEASGELILRNLVLDPLLPDALFTRKTLLQGRFPSF